MNNNNNPNKSINDSGKSDNDRQNGEENRLLKKSSTFNLENDIADIKIDNINNNDDSIQKSQTLKEENNNRLNLYRVSDNGLNHLATVLETINEVSNSRIGSSEINSNNNNKNNNKNNCIKAIKKENKK